MTHSVAAASNAALAPGSATARAARTTGASFAAAHAAAVNASTGTDTTHASGSSSASSSASDAPKGESTQKVTGHSYVEIISGPRNGMFINNTGGKRDGEAFVIVKRHGREFHIYGTGADRAVYEVGRKREDTPASGSTGTTGTGTAGTTGATTAGTAGAQTAPATTR